MLYAALVVGWLWWIKNNQPLGCSAHRQNYPVTYLLFTYFSHLLTYLFTFLWTYLLIYLLTCLLTYYFLLTYLLTFLVTFLLICLLTCLLTHYLLTTYSLLTHSLIHSFPHLLTYLLTYLYFLSFCSFNFYFLCLWNYVFNLSLFYGLEPDDLLILYTMLIMEYIMKTYLRSS